MASPWVHPWGSELAVTLQQKEAIRGLVRLLHTMALRLHCTAFHGEKYPVSGIFIPLTEFRFTKKYSLMQKHQHFSKDAFKGGKWSHRGAPTYIYLKQQKAVGSLLYLQRAQSDISALQNDEWVTADHTKLDNRADMEKADSQTKKNGCLYEGTACRRRDLGVPFQLPCHLSTHPPTTSVEHTEPWMVRRAERRLPLTRPPTVRKFLGAVMHGGGSNPAFMVNLFRMETQSCAQWGTGGLCRQTWPALPH